MILLLGLCQAIPPIKQEGRLEGARDNVRTPRGSLFQLLGCHGAEPPRTLGIITAGDFDRALQNWRILDAAPATTTTAPTIAQFGQAGVFARTCRFLCGMEPAAVPTYAAPAAPSTGSTTATRKVKMSHIINQTDDDEIDILDSAAVTQAYKNYHDRIGGFPPDDEELTTEQLTTLHALFNSNRAPYTDMAVWEPFQHRLQKRMKMKGVRFSATGELIPIEYMDLLSLKLGGSATWCLGLGPPGLTRSPQPNSTTTRS